MRQRVEHLTDFSFDWPQLKLLTDVVKQHSVLVHHLDYRVEVLLKLLEVDVCSDEVLLLVSRGVYRM